MILVKFAQTIQMHAKRVPVVTDIMNLIVAFLAKIIAQYVTQLAAHNANLVIMLMKKENA